MGPRVHNSLAFLYHFRPDPAVGRAEYHLRRSMDLFKAQAGEPSRDVASPLLGLGNLLMDWGQCEQAAVYLENCLTAGGHRRAVAYAYQMLARLCGERGDGDRAYGDRAYGHLAAQLAIFRDLGDAGGLASTLDAYAGWAASNGQWERSARLVGAAEPWRELVGISRWPWQQPQAEVLRAIGEALGADEANRAGEVRLKVEPGPPSTLTWSEIGQIEGERRSSYTKNEVRKGRVPIKR